jgi:hypothetical protein
MVVTASRTTLAAEAIAELSSIVSQLFFNAPPTRKSARNFYSLLNRRLLSAQEWLENPRSSDRELELLVCLESICAVSFSTY